MVMASRPRITLIDYIELQAVVKFGVGLNMSPVERLKQIESSDTLPTCGKTFVYKCHE